jgi:hypothetical protein
MAQIESRLMYEKQNQFFEEWLEELRNQYAVRKYQDVIKTMGEDG